MLDTNMCIYVLKNRSDKLRYKFKAIKNIIISTVTYAELCFGIEYGQYALRAARWQQLDLFAQRLLIDPWNVGAAKHYGQIRAELKRQGNIIGNNDLLSGTCQKYGCHIG